MMNLFRILAMALCLVAFPVTILAADRLPWLPEPSAEATARVKVGLAFERREEHDKAIAAFAAAQTLAPDWPVALLDLAQALDRAGGHGLRAAVWYRAFLAVAETSEQAERVRSRIQSLLDDEKRYADRVMQAAIDTVPLLGDESQRAGWIFDLANAYARLDRPETAIDFLRPLMKWDDIWWWRGPDSAKRIARSLARNGNAARALHVVERIVRESEQRSETEEVARLLVQNGRPDEALAALNRLPFQVPAFIGNDYAERVSYAEARQGLNVLRDIVAAYAGQGEFDKAQRAMSGMILSPQYMAAQRALAVALARRGAWDDAERTVAEMAPAAWPHERAQAWAEIASAAAHPAPSRGRDWLNRAVTEADAFAREHADWRTCYLNAIIRMAIAKATGALDGLDAEERLLRALPCEWQQSGERRAQAWMDLALAWAVSGDFDRARNAMARLDETDVGEGRKYYRVSAMETFQGMTQAATLYGRATLGQAELFDWMTLAERMPSGVLGMPAIPPAGVSARDAIKKLLSPAEDVLYWLPKIEAMETKWQALR